jgi:hypothetical protein
MGNSRQHACSQGLRSFGHGRSFPFKVLREPTPQTEGPARRKFGAVIGAPRVQVAKSDPVESLLNPQVKTRNSGDLVAQRRAEDFAHRRALEQTRVGRLTSKCQTKAGMDLPRQALERYRRAFRVLAEEVLRTEGARFPGLTSEGLAAIAVSFINGCAVQAMIDPDRFDIEEYLVAVQGIGGQFPLAA